MLRVRVRFVVLVGHNLRDLLGNGLILGLAQPESGDSEDSLVENDLSTTETGVHQPDAKDVLDNEIGVETEKEKR